MRKILASMTLALMGWASTVSAQSSVVVVELYTSQGCSSCPPADEILTDIADRDDIIALGLHVDYWDYLGWKDKLAQHSFTERQARYNAIMKSRHRLVTPQMIFQGRDYVAGAKKREALEYIEMLSKMPEGAQLEIKKDGGSLRISLAPNAGSEQQADLHVVRYTEREEVAIKGGENRGKTIHYTNVVTEWATVAEWNGRDILNFSQSIDDDQRVAVIVQARGHGPILAARRLD
ncbi:MAG: DUF1223 domain-containing protein [Rhodobacteraceae bacterium]|nr:DUF1223 domain-containing protein [Paracoccaceae bacterium]